VEALPIAESFIDAMSDAAPDTIRQRFGVGPEEAFSRDAPPHAVSVAFSFSCQRLPPSFTHHAERRYRRV